jgi:glycosyltransferase involved in cell wall biosynthesis
VKICLVSDGLPPHCGGLPLIAYRRARGLHSIPGVEVTLVAWDRFSDRNRQESYPDYVHPVRLDWPGFGGIRTASRHVAVVAHLARLGACLGALLFRLRHEFDVLHAVGAASWSSLLSIPLAKVLQKPVILEMAALGADDPLTQRQRSNTPDQQLFPHRPLRYSLFVQADAYVSISRGLSEAYRQAGLPESRLFQIPYGIDANEFKPPTSREKRELRDRLGLDQGNCIVLFVGRITSTKRVRQLIAAYRQVNEAFPDTDLLIVGPNMPPDPEYAQAVRNDIEESKLSERIKLVGVDRMVNNVAEYMRASDVFCLPSEREGLGLVNIEAMACGLPVVVSRLQGVTTEFIKSGRDGILVPVGDTARLAEALKQLLGDASLRKQIGTAARERVVKEFSLETHYRRHLDLYEQLLAD